MQQDISEIKDQIAEIMSLSSDMKIPLALKRIIRDTFKCTICLAVPIKPPVIVTKCCKTILGCETCVNGWFNGTEPSQRHVLHAELRGVIMRQCCSVDLLVTDTHRHTDRGRNGSAR